MAYGSKYHIIHKARSGNTETTIRLELQQNGFSGTSTELTGAGDIFTHEYEGIDIEDPFEEPIQKSRLELHALIQNSNDLTILESVFGSDEDEYRLVKKINGSVDSTYKVLPDLLSYSEGAYPFLGSFVGKDLSGLSGSDFPLENKQETIITTIARILDVTGFNIDIHTYTNWEYASASGDDYLNLIKHNTSNLRNYATSDSEQDTPFTNLKAIEEILRAHKLILRQSNNVWNVYHISALKDPTNVKRYVYDSTGVQQSTSTVDLTTIVDRQSSFVLPNSVNRFKVAIKDAKYRFKHRTLEYGIDFPSSVSITDTEPDKSYTQDFKSDGGQSVYFKCDVSAVDFAGGDADAVTVNIGVTGYGYNNNAEAWQVNGAVDIPLHQSGTGTTSFNGSIQFKTPNIPNDEDIESIGITLRKVTTSAGTAETTTYSNITFAIFNPTDEDGENETPTYELIQSGNYSGHYDGGDILFGDGPFPYSPARLMWDNSGILDPTDGQWRFVGETDTWPFHQLALKEVMNWFRKPVRRLEASLWGNFSPQLVISHDSNYYFFLGGSQTGRNITWDADIAKISHSNQTDTLSKVLTVDSAAASATVDGATNSVVLQNKDAVKNQRITTTTSALSGTVTNIDIEAVGEQFVTVGDTFYVFDKQTGALISFVLDAPQKATDTSLSVQSKTLSRTIPSGAWIIFNGEKISSYITRSDTAVKLGVKTYDQAVDESDEPLVDENGEEIVFTDEDEGSTLQLLQEQATLKVNSDGKVALVRLDTSAEEGSVISISADQVRINNATFDEQAGTFTVGTDPNVAVMDGGHATYRIYAGNADPTQAPFRVKQDGTVEATKVVTLEGSVDGSGDFIGSIDKLLLKQLQVTDTITVDTGEIKTVDTVTAGAVDYDVNTSFKNGILTFTIDDPNSSTNRTVVIQASADSTPNAEILLSDNSGNEVRIKQTSIVLKTGTSGDEVGLLADGLYAMEFGDNYVDIGKSAVDEYVSILVNGVQRYIKLYS